MKQENFLITGNYFLNIKIVLIQKNGLIQDETFPFLILPLKKSWII